MLRIYGIKSLCICISCTCNIFTLDISFHFIITSPQTKKTHTDKSMQFICYFSNSKMQKFIFL